MEMPGGADSKARRGENCCRTGLVEGNATEVMLGYRRREDAATANLGLGIHDLESSCKNEEIKAYRSLEDNLVAVVISRVEEQDRSEKQTENSVYLSEFEMVKETMSEATSKDQSDLVPVVLFTFSEQEPAREPHC